MTAVLIALALAAAPNPVCFDAPVQGQKLRKVGKLLDARDQFFACAQKECPREIVDDCAKWASEVEAALPSIVVAARDGQHDIEGATVSIDGAAPAPVSTRAIRVDPDKHVVVVKTSKGEQRREVSLHEGEHDRMILVQFAATAPAATLSSSSMRPGLLTTLIVGGVGVVGFVSFAIFATLGMITRTADHCDTPTPGCPNAQANLVETEFHVSTGSLVVGLVGLAAAVVLYFVVGGRS